MKIWFLNLGIGKKLTYIFSLLIILTIAITILGILHNSNLNDSVVRFSKSYFPADDLLLNIDRDLQQALVAERSLLAGGLSSGNITQFKKDYSENISQIEDRWNQFKKIDIPTDISENVKNFESAFLNWKDLSEKIIDKASTGSDSLRAVATYLALNEKSDSFGEARNVIDDLGAIIVKDAGADIDASGTNINKAIFQLFGGLLTYLLIAVLVSYFIYKTVINATKKTSKLISDLGIGRLNSRIEVSTKDEFGEMGNKLNQFAEDLQKYVIGSMRRISEGDFDFEIPSKDKYDEIAPALNDTINTLKRLKAETDTMLSYAREGDLESKGDVDKFHGGYRDIINGLNETTSTIVKNVRIYEDVIEKIGNGDLSARMLGDYKGNYKILQKRANDFAETLSNLISNISEAVQATASAANEISSSTEEMAAGAQEQNSQTADVAGAVEEMTKTIIETTKNSGTASGFAKEAGKIAKEGGLVVSDTVVGMERIANVVQKSSTTIRKLGKSSDQIGEIIQVIDDIADQTNLLALNAAIEAARAGEQGRGFAVVADEVRKLAERTTKATKEIAVMIKQIQTDTNGAVRSIDEGNEEVEKGKALAGKAGESLRSIIEATNKVLDVVNMVASASEEQSTAAEQISRNIEAISNVTQESATGTQQIARASEDLSRLTTNLQTQLSKFKIKKDVRTTKKPGYSIRNNGKELSAQTK